MLYVMRVACYDCDFVGERGDQMDTCATNAKNPSPYIGFNPQSYVIPQR